MLPAQFPLARRLGRRVRMLPVLVANAPWWILIVVGLGISTLGMFLLARPLSALGVLGIYIGLSCVVSGLGDLLRCRRSAEWPALVTGSVWILAGLAIITWLGRSIELLGPTVALLLVVAGLGKLSLLIRDRVADRLLDALFGLAEIAFGLVALLWPDATLIIVALLFGVRSSVFGLTLVWRGIVTRVAPPDTDDTAEERQRKHQRGRFVVLRWMTAFLILLMAVSTLVLSYQFRRGIPVVDPFYDTPASVPATPGQLIRDELYEGELPAGLTAYRILYTTTAAEGVPAVASGVLAVPSTPSSAPMPVIAWAHGTVGVARACAPSIGRYAITTEGMPAMDALARNGWAMVATDYTGMGAEGTFPYLIGQGEGRSVLDAVRAARQIPGVNLTSETVVWGHSQGGHAALWTGQIASSYAPEVKVLGTAALSPASDPLGMAEAVAAHPDRPGASLAIAFVLDAYSRTYPDIVWSEVVAPSARTIVKEAAARCTSIGGTLITILTGLAIARDQPILRESPTGGVIGHRLRENIPYGPWITPLFIGQGTEDEVIPLSLQDRYVSTLCGRGQPLEYKRYPVRNHMGVLAPDSPLNADLEQWTKDRLAGRSAPDTCS